MFGRARELVRFAGSADTEQDDTPPAKLPAPPPPLELPLIDLSHDSEASAPT